MKSKVDELCVQDWAIPAQLSSSQLEAVSSLSSSLDEPAAKQPLLKGQYPQRALSFQRRRQHTAYEELVPPPSLSTPLSSVDVLRSAVCLCCCPRDCRVSWCVGFTLLCAA